MKTKERSFYICVWSKISLLFVATMITVFILITDKTTCFAARNINQERLVTRISNPSNGKLSFYLNIPAGTTVTYKMELIPNRRTGSIDTKKGSYRNRSKPSVSKKNNFINKILHK